MGMSRGAFFALDHDRRRSDTEPLRLVVYMYLRPDISLYRLLFFKLYSRKGSSVGNTLEPKHLEGPLLTPLLSSHSRHNGAILFRDHDLPTALWRSLS